MPGTSTVSMDEWAYILYEVNKPAPDSRSVRRYRHIQVVRADRLAEYVQDMGPSDIFREEFSIPGGVIDEKTGKFSPEHTVGELVTIAEQLYREPYDMNEIEEDRLDLVGGYWDTVEKRFTNRDSE
jgi:hypothetical protein